MYAPYQVDWNRRGYFTPSLHGRELPPDTRLHAQWRELRAHFDALRRADFAAQTGLVALAREASCGMMCRYFLRLLSDGPSQSFPDTRTRAVADRNMGRD